MLKQSLIFVWHQRKIIYLYTEHVRVLKADFQSNAVRWEHKI